MEKKKWKKEKKNCGRPTGFNFSHPLDRKQIFFYGQPQEGYWCLLLHVVIRTDLKRVIDIYYYVSYWYLLLRVVTQTDLERVIDVYRVPVETPG